MGRVIRNWQQTPSTSPGGGFVYQTYNLAGNVTSATNAAGVTISYAYDSAARPTIVTSSWSDAQHPATLYTVDPSVGYFPNGATRKATLANGLTESAMYNSRLQSCRLEINSAAAYFTQCTGAAPSGNVLDFTYGFNSGVSDNGNVANWSSVGNQTFTRSYGYDSLNRISTLSDTATAQICKGLSWTIDPWGNRTDQNVTAGSCGTFHALIGTTNRFGSPYQYDAAGNMTYDGIHSYTYDAENHITQVDAGAAATYIYAPDGHRVRKNSGGSWTEYFYDASGSVTAEHSPAGWPVVYVYVGGKLVAQYRDSTTYSIFRDHLGSTRLITKLDKSVYDSLDFLPFGEQLAGDTGTTHKFTGKERDSESGLDNFGARYDSSRMGRFMSPDPLYLEMHRLTDPQQLNLYSYVRNNPLTLTDPDGMDITVICAGKANCTTATDQVNARKDGQFNVEIGKDGKWHPVGDVDVSKLSGAEKAFYNALSDTNTHATLTAVSGDGSVFFGLSTGKGTNTVDVGDTAQLSSAGLSPGTAVAHEAMEAYATAGGASLSDAHNNDPFPGFTILGRGGRATVSDGNVTGYQYTLRYGATGANYQVNTTLKTPIPVSSFVNPQTREAAQKSINEQITSVTPK